MPKKKSTKKATIRTQDLNTRLLIVGALIGVLLVFILLMKTHPTYAPQMPMQNGKIIPFDFGDKSFTLNDQNVTFIHGEYSHTDQISGTHTARVTNQSVNPSENRAAAVIVDNPGGSGTFYYLVGSMLVNGKETYSTPMLLGDRINIMSLTVDDPEAHDNGEITVNYLDRGANDPMSDEPTIKKTKRFSFEENGNLIEVLH